MVLNRKHFTATAFVLHPDQDKILLHWHKKVMEWLPPGGHIEKNESPEEAVVREVREESGLSIKLFSNKSIFKNIGDIKELEKPESLLLEPIDDPKEGKHFHIDMIYFAEAINPERLKAGWIWVNEQDLIKKSKLEVDEGKYKHPPEDVIVLAINCINKRRKNGN
ncbi:MAG: DNA mismatch repair protein MutT [Chloroflexi bacterium]|mgnify:FL=1|nr:DNA mismatch repair protein MutT [Chloroflexota bacterium]|tara:strand:- start:10537 stop:11031 length:495 start_codon:yes stop_codon:yes gene_type:complete